MRWGQAVPFLSTDMTASEWRALNDVSKSTLFVLMAGFRESEPKLFGNPNASERIELTLESIFVRTAIAVCGDASAVTAFGPEPVQM